MPKIILLINEEADNIVSNDRIICYVLSDNLSATKYSEASSSGKMVLVKGENALAKCKEFNLDGVVKEIDPKKPLKVQVKSLREALKNKTLGIIIPARRHEAMLAGEVEPEFIAFYSDNPAQDEDLLSWYNDLFLIPSAWVVQDNFDKAKTIAADFLMIEAKKIKNFGC